VVGCCDEQLRGLPPIGHASAQDDAPGDLDRASRERVGWVDRGRNHGDDVRIHPVLLDQVVANCSGNRQDRSDPRQQQAPIVDVQIGHPPCRQFVTDEYRR
jgi:hypothetical protein